MVTFKIKAIKRIGTTVSVHSACLLVNFTYIATVCNSGRERGKCITLVVHYVNVRGMLDM